MLEKGIQSLVQQCLELEELVKGKPSAGPRGAFVALAKSAQRYAPKRPTGLRISKVAEKQISMAAEEDGWMQRVVLGCWTTLLADAARARRKASVSKVVMQQPSRTHCLTS